MSKPTWRPVLPDDAKDRGVRFCACCGWRTTTGTFCGSCMARVGEAPPQSPRPAPLKVKPHDHPSVRRRGHRPEEKAWIDSLLPVTCAACGAGDHESTACPGRSA